MDRETIKKEALKIFGSKNFQTLTSQNIEELFNLYDDFYFKGEIREKLGPSILEFKTGTRKTGQGAITGFERTKPPTYYIDIAPRMLQKLFNHGEKGLPVAAGIKDACKDKLGCLLLIMEHEIVHLIMMLWGYSTEGPKAKKKSLEELYGPHGRLYQCLLARIFGHTRADHDLGILDISDGPKPVLKSTKKVAFLTGYDNWSYSCYLDSVLIILFYGKSSFWRDVIFDEDPFSNDLKGTDLILAKDVQEQLLIDYKSLHDKGKIVKCSVLRKLLVSKEHRLKEYGKWVMYNAGAAYEVLCSIIPNFQIDIPIQVQRWTKKGYKGDTVKYAREAMLTFWDYMDPLSDIESGENYKMIRWDLIQSPVLVFNNGGAPRIKKLNETGREKGVNYILNQKHNFDVIKARKFGEYIIDNRYELIGVVVLHGVSKKGEGGEHYTSYFKSKGGLWYEYDDLGPSVDRIDALPETGVWVEEKGQMPSMYFYQKISSSPRPDKIKIPSIEKYKPNIKPTRQKDTFPDKMTYSSDFKRPEPLGSPVILENDKILYKRLDRDDGSTLFSIKDKTVMKKQINLFLDVVKQGHTSAGYISRTPVQHSDTITWKAPTSMMDKIEKELVGILKKI